MRKQDIKITGKSAQVTTGDGSHIYNNLNKTQINWFFLSFLIALVVCLTSIYFFNSLKIGLVIGIFSFIFIFFLNPKRRFFRMGWLTIGISSSLFSLNFISLEIPRNEYIFGKLQMGSSEYSTNLAILLLFLSAWLFYLDSKEKN